LLKSKNRIERMAEHFFGRTDTGRQRDNNEDAFFVESIRQGTAVAACVIDGVGGYEGGEIAAGIARQTLQGALKQKGSEAIAVMRQAFLQANALILQEKGSDAALRNMSCVATMAIADLRSNQLHYAHVGDTRLYLFRDERLIKLTKDHSFVGMLEDTGRLSEAEAMQHPKRNELEKALGFEIATADDFVETGSSPFLPGDQILLCSDGLTDLVTAESICRVLRSGISLEQKASALIDAANAAGGKDNITVVLVHNNKKLVKQKAQRPATLHVVPPTNKDEGLSATPPVSGKPPRFKPLDKKNRNKTAVISLSVLCVVLMGGLGYLIWKQYKGESDARRAAMTVVKNEKELELQRLINETAGDTLLLDYSFFGGSVRLTDTLTIDRDSLYIRSNLALQKDSGFTSGGPAVFITPRCKWIVLDGLHFQNFGTALLAGNKDALELKNTRFTNCPVTLAYGSSGEDFFHGTFVNTRTKPDVSAGRASESRDSIPSSPKPRREP
jgi:PPM family protein phosphatase